MELLQLHQPSHTSLYATINTLPLVFQQVLGTITLPPDNGLSLVFSLRNGTLFGSCDGSGIRKHERTWGGHSYSIQDWNTDVNAISGHSPTPMSNNLSSLTSEMYGLLATTTIVYALSKHHKIPDTSSLQMTIMGDYK